MPTYNPNDFYPRSGAEIKSDGTVVNEADGKNADGSQNVQIIGTNNKVQVVDSTGANSLVMSSLNLYGDANNLNFPGLFGLVGSLNYNGTNWDRQRGIPGTKGVLATAYSGMQSLTITTATTSVVKASSGVIGTLINAGTSTSGTVTIYDNTSATGKTIWSGTLTAGQVLPLGIPCGTGITIVTGAANTITVSYA